MSDRTDRKVVSVRADLMARVEQYRATLQKRNPGLPISTSDALHAALTIGLDADSVSASARPQGLSGERINTRKRPHDRALERASAKAAEDLGRPHAPAKKRARTEAKP
jgi:hypothetical protein